MSPRPRKASDDEVFRAAQRVMTRVGPAGLTLADIAAEAGLTAGALVQRFGSRRALMVAMTERFSGGAGDFIAQLRLAHPPPLAALRAYVDCMAGLAATPAAFVRNLAYLQNDLSDPELRKHLAVHARATRKGLQQMLRDAVAAGELTSTAEPRSLARLIEAVISGSMMTWAFSRRGTAVTWMRGDLEALLRPYLRKPRGRSIPTSRHPRHT